MKTCITCKQSKSDMSFAKNRKVLSTVCRECKREYLKQHRIKTATKKCKDCQEYLSLDSFDHQRINTDLLCPVCISCNDNRIRGGGGYETGSPEKIKKPTVKDQKISKLEQRSDDILDGFGPE